MILADAGVFVARFGDTWQHHATQALAVIQRSRPDMPPVFMAMSQRPETVVALPSTTMPLRAGAIKHRIGPLGVSPLLELKA